MNATSFWIAARNSPFRLDTQRIGLCDLHAIASPNVWASWVHAEQKTAQSYGL